MTFVKRLILVVVLMTMTPVSGRAAPAPEATEGDTILAMIQPYLDQVRPYLAPLEDIMREQAEAFKGFVEDISSGGERRGTPKAVIDLPPPSLAAPQTPGGATRP